MTGADPIAWVLILHTLLSGGTWKTIHLGPYSEGACHHAAAGYEAAARVTVHHAREPEQAENGEGGDSDMIMKSIAICIPGPNLVPRAPALTPR